MPINLTQAHSPKRRKGFTLIELVIGIVVLAFSFTIISTLLFPAAKQSAEHIHQIRAAELGQSLLNEILGKAFDENSDMVGGKARCGEGSSTCTQEANMGAEEGSANRALFNDVDDYNGLNVIENSLGDPLDTIYKGFKVYVAVCNDGDFNGVCLAVDSIGDNQTAKLIVITVTTAQGYEIEFSSYKANF